MYIDLSQSRKQIITSSVIQKKNIAHLYLFNIHWSTEFLS